MKVAALALGFIPLVCGQSLTQVLSSNPQLSQLANLITPYQSQFANLNNITLLAPNNAAIGAVLNSSVGQQLASQPDLVQALLSYHIIQGNYSNITNTSFLRTALTSPQYANVTGGQRVEATASGGNVTFFSGLLQNSSVVNASIPFSGGTIHVINRFLTLPQNVSATAVALNLTSALGAVSTLNLSSAVSAPDLTLFLPNNAAFQRIGSALANLSTANLTSILTYHVVPGVYYSTNITNGSSVATAGGQNVTLRILGSNVYVNGAKVVQPNVLIANGVVHVIDAVLNPANATQTPNTSSTVDAFPGATSGSVVPFTSGIPTPTSSIASASHASAQASGSSSSSGGAWRPVETGAVGMAALFGGAAALMNI